MKIGLRAAAFLVTSLAFNAPGAFADTAVPARISPSATATIPAKIAEKAVRIAVVRQLNTGDVYENWIAGIRREAKQLGIRLEVYNANGDNAKEGLFLQEAVATKPSAIIVGWGFADSLSAGLQAAKAAKIPVITFDVGAPVSDRLTAVHQSDEMMMRGILAKLKSDLGAGAVQAKVIYAYVAGYQALDRRNVVWQEFLKENPGIKVVAQIGVVNSNTAAQTANQAQAALTANPDVVAIVAPYDEFAKGASLAVEELKRQNKVKVYGVDISTADIATMTSAGSPWTVTATTDMVNVGAVVLRTAAAKVVGQLVGNTVVIPPAVITQQELRRDNVHNMDELRKSFPALSTPQLISEPWMSAVK